jgi:hypothetical protein
MDKQYSIKLYDKTGITFKGQLAQQGSYSFQESLNGGLGEMSMVLPKSFDDIAGVSHLDMIEIWVQDKDTTGLKIYSGYIFRIKRIRTPETENIEISSLGYGSRFGFTPDMSSTTAISVARLSMTVPNMVKDVIDKYITTIGDSIVNYNATSIDTSATTLSYTSNVKTVIQTIEKIREMAGSTWFWKVDANNIFYFKEFSLTPDHTLTLGKDITDITIVEDSDNIYNMYYLWNALQVGDANLLSKIYSSSTSIASYWKRFNNVTDGRITVEGTLDALGAGLINANKDINKSVIFTIKDNNFDQGYDIESVHVGQTVRILNNNNVDLYNGNLVITGITYTPESIQVITADARSITSRKLNDLRTSLDQTIYEDAVPTATLTDLG